jgi:hypothetical protein
MVKFNFSRFTKNDQLLSYTEAIHFLVTADRGWKIKTVAISGPSRAAIAPQTITSVSLDELPHHP